MAAGLYPLAAAWMTLPWLCQELDEQPLVHPNQTLRLFLRECIDPPSLVLGEWRMMGVGCRNEYGLWRRADFWAEEPIPLEVTPLMQGGCQLAVTTEPGTPSLDASGKTNFRVKVEAKATGPMPSNVLLKISADPKGLRPLLPVLTPPLKLLEVPQPGPALTSQLTMEQCRLLEVPFRDDQILCAECQGDLGIGGRVWDGCLVMLEYLAMNPGLLEGQRCIELGSGTGLLGIGSALLGASQVCLTDLESVVPLLELNIHLNQHFNPLLRNQAALQCLTARPYPWGSEISGLVSGPVDLVLMAEVVYNAEASKALVQSLAAFATGPKTPKFLMCYRNRNEDDPAFFHSLAAAGFEIQEMQSKASRCPDIYILQLLCATLTVRS